MRRQEIFDAVVEHFIQQGAPAVIRLTNGGVTCCYRTIDGLKCAIGALIPDDLYVPEMEGESVSSLFHAFPLEAKAAGLSRSSARFFDALQKAHDINALGPTSDGFLERLWGHMRIIAKDFRLNGSKIPEGAP